MVDRSVILTTPTMALYLPWLYVLWLYLLWLHILWLHSLSLYLLRRLLLLSPAVRQRAAHGERELRGAADEDEVLLARLVPTRLHALGRARVRSGLGLG